MLCCTVLCCVVLCYNISCYITTSDVMYFDNTIVTPIRILSVSFKSFREVSGHKNALLLSILFLACLILIGRHYF